MQTTACFYQAVVNLVMTEYRQTRYGETFYALDAAMRREQHDLNTFFLAGLVGGLVQYKLEGPSGAVYGSGKLDNLERTGVSPSVKGMGIIDSVG